MVNFYLQSKCYRFLIKCVVVGNWNMQCCTLITGIFFPVISAQNVKLNGALYEFLPAMKMMLALKINVFPTLFFL